MSIRRKKVVKARKVKTRKTRRQVALAAIKQLSVGVEEPWVDQALEQIVSRLEEHHRQVARSTRVRDLLGGEDWPDED